MGRCSPPAPPKLLIVLCVSSHAFVLSVAAQELANLYSAQGTVEKRLSASTPWNAAEVKSRFENGNACRTGLNSRGAVLFVDGVLIRMNETTLLEFKSGTAGN